MTSNATFPQPSAAAMAAWLAEKSMCRDAQSAIVAIPQQCQGLASSSEGDALSDVTRDISFLLDQRVFSAACGIAHHNLEPIVRLSVFTPTHSSTLTGTDEQSPNSAVSRFVFRVGSHLVFPPPAVFCSCPSFRFQTCQKGETSACKHLVALRLALAHDQRLSQSDCDAVVGSTTVSRRIIRESFITAEEFVSLLRE